MGFSGFYQCLDESGHLHQIDVYDFDEEDFYCEDCKSTKVVWINLVDTTNLSSYEYPLQCRSYPLKLIKKGGERKYCEHCNSLIGYELDIYEIPTKEEVENYYNSKEYKKALKAEEKKYLKELKELEKLNKGDF